MLFAGQMSNICTDKTIGDILAGWRYDISPLAPQMRGDYEQHLRGCDGLMIESNHDLEMLRSGPYPWMVKQRVMSRVGHLSNAALADFFETDYDGQATFLVLAHLSEQYNHPELARETAYQALGSHMNLFQSCTLTLAQQDKPLQPLCLG